jgi:hypothetical protein
MNLSTLDRQRLCEAYVAAWKAVKNLDSKITVEPSPAGWYVINLGHPQSPRRVRARELIKGLATLASRLERGDAAVCKGAQQ